MPKINEIKKEYVRDNRSPSPKNENVSKVMSSNKGKNTGLEIKFRKELFYRGIRGYRLHAKDLPGKPDIVFRKKKVAIFIHGCYWHHCPKCQTRIPKHNSEFWLKKFTANQERDERKIQQLEELGWKVIVVWECEIRSDLDNIIGYIYAVIQSL